MLGSSTWSMMQLLEFFGPKILFSIICGGIIGLERELKNKAAGIKTNILICVGSTLYTAISLLISTSFAEDGYYGDPARLAAQIIPGIGFIGGGTIIQARGTILGLTTAATIWIVAAIGVAIGIGRADVGIAVSLIVVFVLVATNFFEDRVLGRSLSFACEILVDDPQGEVRSQINQALASNDLMLEDFNISSQRGQREMSLLSIRYSGRHTDHKKFVLELWSIKGVREVRQV